MSFADQLPCCGVDPRWAKERASCTAHTLTVQSHPKGMGTRLDIIRNKKQNWLQ